MDTEETHLVTLDVNALSFIVNEFKFGNSLAKLLLEVISSYSGKVKAYLPVKLDKETISDFNLSIHLSTKIDMGKAIVIFSK